MNTIVNELKIKIYLLKDINSINCNTLIAMLIDKCLAKDEYYSIYHKENKYKNYCFNLLYPLEVSKVYKEGGIYTFIIRTVDKNLAEFLVKNLVNEYTDNIKVLTITKTVIPKKIITDIYSITPIIIKTDNGYWKNNISLDEFEERLKINLIKKWNSFHDTKINEDFELFKTIRFNNKKPVATNYKDIKLLGDKLNISISENDLSQELIYFALGTGLGELGARGFGFLNFKWL
ncbi:CRISPR-associated endoribonuclease Cas6 [Clostridium cavendishii DSM 21758]|uniref:CRISPR-associated endoribonuclease Cas6 n=1 Tax=Clostridium cavendishii DSM 21758 TaxID=1121302 RepID=A0A1M6VE97_9CLOT|nr:CRISPR-associated endoribonuclease Cas6 [Clostridium cavendishii]SHK79606.1 CRISPR-associated endoribonuclease Cas6 [Clostridium cavendishii DSM 21758]